MTESNTKHSPEYRVDENAWGTCIMDGRRFVAFKMKRKAEAELFVTAVNERPALLKQKRLLVEALREYLEAADDPTPGKINMKYFVARFRAAIKSAGE